MSDAQNKQIYPLKSIKDGIKLKELPQIFRNMQDFIPDELETKWKVIFCCLTCGELRASLYDTG